MDTIETLAAVEPASSAKLSLEISELVRRALAGESIDMPAEGETLAGRYSDLGMTGEMIGSAIARAIGMVGAIRSDSGGSSPDAANGGPGNGPGENQPQAAAPGARIELADMMARSADPILLQETGREPQGAIGQASETAEDPAGAPELRSSVARFSLRSVAAVRRALLRH